MSREDPDIPPWGWAEELLAQVIEEVSVLAADKRRKEPRQVKRPFDTGSPEESNVGLTTNASGGQTAVGHDAVLAMFASRMRTAPAELTNAPAAAPAEGTDGG